MMNKRVRKRVVSFFVSAALAVSPMIMPAVRAEGNIEYGQNEVQNVESEIEYVAVSSPFISISDRQKIVVAFSDPTILSAQLFYERESDEELLSVHSDEITEGVAVFSMSFHSDNMTGTYHLVSAKIVTGEGEGTVNFSEIGIDPKFGVNTYCETEPDAVAVEEREKAEDASIMDPKESREQDYTSQGRTAAFLTLDADGNMTENEDVDKAIEVSEQTVKSEEEHPDSTSEGSHHEEVIEMSDSDFDPTGEWIKMTKNGQIVRLAMGDVRPVNKLATGSDTDKKDNLVIVLDPGHGGFDPGAYGINGSREKDLTLKIAKYCRDELKKYDNVTVYMTRENDTAVGGATGVRDDLINRVEVAKRYKADIFVSIHLNASGLGTAKGAEVYYPNKNYRPDASKEGEELARNIQEKLIALGIADRGVKIRNSSDKSEYPDGSLSDYYSVIWRCKEAGIPGIIVEHAFIDNQSDYYNYLNSDSKLKKLGEADAKGLVAAYKLKLNQSHVNTVPTSPVNPVQNTTGWKKDSAGWRWMDTDRYYIKAAWKRVDGSWYYFDSNSYMATGWRVINGAWYYFADWGGMTTGWRVINGTWYYFTDSGEMVTGWRAINGAWYYFADWGGMTTGWKVINGTWYYFADWGGMATGWRAINGTWYYFADWGGMVTGWRVVDGTWYYFADWGGMVTGWRAVNGTWYYFANSGEMITGWRAINGTWYYFADWGGMATGWCSIQGKWYYMKAGGAMAANEHIGGYYFHADGAMAHDEWISYYYVGSNGQRVPGRTRSGWIKENAQWWYRYSDGSYAKNGWVQIAGQWYLFDAAGWMLTGWQSHGGYEYYLDPEQGAMRTGWVDYNGGRFYFTEKSNQKIPLGALDKSVTESTLKPTVVKEQHTPIMGKTSLGNDKATAVKKMVQLYRDSKVIYPSELSKGGAPDISTFCEFIYDEATAENVRPEIVFGQAMKETGFLKFGGDVKVSQYNFAGLGAAGNGATGLTFADVRTGIRAHVQHLKAYASNEALKKQCVDPRFKYVKRNTAPYVEWLGIQENPNKAGWASAKNYGYDLIKYYVEPMLSKS